MLKISIESFIIKQTKLRDSSHCSILSLHRLFVCAIFLSLPFKASIPPNTKAPKHVIARKFPSFVKFDRAINTVTLSHSPYLNASPPFGGIGALYPLGHLGDNTAGLITGESSLLQNFNASTLH